MCPSFPPHPPTNTYPPKVFELQPDIAWDKGKAVLWLLDELVVPSALPSSAAEAATATTAAVSEDSRSAGVTKVNIVGDAGEGHGRSATASTGHAAGNGEDEDDDSNHGGDDEGAWNFFTIFIGDDKTDEVSGHRSYILAGFVRTNTAPMVRLYIEWIESLGYFFSTHETVRWLRCSAVQCSAVRYSSTVRPGTEHFMNLCDTVLGKVRQ